MNIPSPEPVMSAEVSQACVCFAGHHRAPRPTRAQGRLAPVAAPRPSARSPATPPSTARSAAAAPGQLFLNSSRFEQLSR